MNIEQARALKQTLLKEFDVQANEVSAEDVLSRFEEGQPADPTKNMSPEDAKEWDQNTDEHGDRFKAASIEARVAERFASDSKQAGIGDTRGKPLKNEKQVKESVEAVLTKNRTKWAWLEGLDEGQLGKLAGTIASVLWREHQNRIRSNKRLHLDPPNDMGADNVADFVPNMSRTYAPLVQTDGHELLQQVTKAMEWMESKGMREDSLLLELKQQLRRGVPGALQGGPEILESAIEAYGIKMASKTAGFSYTSEPMSVLFVEKKGTVFNRDTWDEINKTTIPIIGDDGDEHKVELKYVGHEGAKSLNHAQEKQGLKREIRVDITHPVDEGGDPKSSARAALNALVQMGKKLGFKVEPAQKSYKPQHRKASIVEAADDVPEAPDAEAGWQPGQKRNEWNLSLYKYSASRWSYYLTNPEGGGSGSSSYPTSKAAFAAGTRNVAWGEPSVNPGKKKVWVMEQVWDPEAESYKVKSSKWWDIPADLLQKKFNR